MLIQNILLEVWEWSYEGEKRQKLFDQWTTEKKGFILYGRLDIANLSSVLRFEDLQKDKISSRRIIKLISHTLT